MAPESELRPFVCGSWNVDAAQLAVLLDQIAQAFANEAFLQNYLRQVDLLYQTARVRGRTSPGLQVCRNSYVYMVDMQSLGRHVGLGNVLLHNKAHKPFVTQNTRSITRMCMICNVLMTHFPLLVASHLTSQFGSASFEGAPLLISRDCRCCVQGKGERRR